MPSSPNPSPSPVPPASPDEHGWIPIEGSRAVWAPDSQHFTTNVGGLNLYDASGQLIRYVNLVRPSWVDSSHFAAVGTVSRNAVVYDIASDSVVGVGLPAGVDYLTANGRGATALSWPSATNDGFSTDDDYGVWNGTQLSEAQHGFATAWSRDGTKLAVLHIFDGLRDGGWVSVVSWPGLDVLFADAPPFGTGDVAFDPSGRYIAYLTEEGITSSAPSVIRVVDLSSGSAKDVSRDIYGNFYWTPDSDLAVLGKDDTLRIVKPDGTAISQTPWAFLLNSASSDSSTVALWYPPPKRSTIELIRNGQRTVIHAPTDVVNVSVSPDGSSIVADLSDGRSVLRTL